MIITQLNIQGNNIFILEGLVGNIIYVELVNSNNQEIFTICKKNLKVFLYLKSFSNHASIMLLKI